MNRKSGPEKMAWNVHNEVIFRVQRRLSSKRKNESWQPRGTPREMYLHADLSSELRTKSVPVFKIWHRIWRAVTLCSMWSFSHLLIGRVVTSRWMVTWWHTQIPCWEKEGTCRICPSLLWDSHHVPASSFLLPFIYQTCFLAWRLFLHNSDCPSLFWFSGVASQ